MRLDSTDGARVELRPQRYQFPDTAGVGKHDWDANWLVIAGEVRTSDGRSWTFSDPCLTTWEARSLGDWLRGVVSGAVVPTPFDGTGEETLKVSTEPNLALSLAARTTKDATIRVHLSLESRPPWLDDEVDLFDFFVCVELPLTELSAAVATWTGELAGFPER